METIPQVSARRTNVLRREHGSRLLVELPSGRPHRVAVVLALNFATRQREH